GWSTVRNVVGQATGSYQAGIGAAGENGYRLTLSPGAGDNYWGHRRRFGAIAPFAYNDRVYFRWRMRWVPGSNCRSRVQGGTAESGIWRNKIMIVNDAGDGSRSRFIMTVECTSNPLQYYFRLQKGGGVDLAQTQNYPVNTAWMDVQVELQYS